MILCITPLPTLHRFQTYYTHSIQTPSGLHCVRPPPPANFSSIDSKPLTRSPPLHYNTGLLELRCPSGTGTNMEHYRLALPLTNPYLISLNPSRRDRLAECSGNAGGRVDGEYIYPRDRDGQ